MFTERGGKTRTAWVHVNAKNVLPHFGTDGSILTSYTPSKSIFTTSIFQSAGSPFRDRFYPAAFNYGQDMINAGFNTAEFGCQSPIHDGTFSNEQQLLSGASPNATAVTAFGGQIGFLFADSPASGLAAAGAIVALTVAAPPASSSPAIGTIVSAASGVVSSVAPASIATMYGTDLATGTGEPSGGTLPTSLKGTTVTIGDSTGAQQNAPLFYVSQGQINFLIPAGTALGTAQVTVTNSAGQQGSASKAVVSLAPGIFELNASGLAAAVVLIVHPDGSRTTQNIYQLDSSKNIIPLPINLSAGKVYLELYGTGIRNASANSVTVTVGGQNVPVLSSGAQGVYQGLDQVNIGPLPLSLAGAGQADIVLTADGLSANTVNVTFQ